MIYGLPNRVMTALSVQLFKHEHLTKMLYYTTQEYNNVNLLELDPISPSQLIEKNVFVGRRVPIVLKQAGAFVSFRVYDYYPNGGRGTYSVEIDIDVIVHQSCQKTIHGARDITMVAMIHKALEKETLTGIGECRLLNTYDIRDIDIEYSGYTVKVLVKGFAKDFEV